MKKVFSVGIIQYLLQAGRIRLQYKQFAPETFCVLVAFDILSHVNIISSA